MLEKLGRLWARRRLTIMLVALVTDLFFSGVFLLMTPSPDRNLGNALLLIALGLPLGVLAGFRVAMDQEQEHSSKMGSADRQPLPEAAVHRPGASPTQPSRHRMPCPMCEDRSTNVWLILASSSDMTHTGPYRLGVDFSEVEVCWWWRDKVNDADRLKYKGFNPIPACDDHVSLGRESLLYALRQRHFYWQYF